MANNFPQPQTFAAFAGNGQAAQPMQQPQTQPQTQPLQQPQPLAQPQGNPLQQQAQGAQFGPGAFDGTTVNGKQNPTPGPGDYSFVIESTELKTFQGRTHVTDLTIVTSTNPAFPPGMVVSCVKALDGSVWAFKYGSGDVLAMAIAATGFRDEAAFKTGIPLWSPLLNAMCDAAQQQAGNPWGPNPLKARPIKARVVDSGAVIKRGRNAGKPIMNWLWEPAA